MCDKYGTGITLGKLVVRSFDSVQEESRAASTSCCSREDVGNFAGITC